MTPPKTRETSSVFSQPTSLAAAGGGSGHSVQLDLSSLSGADDSLADLQPEPEEEGERRGGWEGLIEEQKVLISQPYSFFFSFWLNQEKSVFD